MRMYGVISAETPQEMLELQIQADREGIVRMRQNMASRAEDVAKANAEDEAEIARLEERSAKFGAALRALKVPA